MNELICVRSPARCHLPFRKPLQRIVWRRWGLFFFVFFRPFDNNFPATKDGRDGFKGRGKWIQMVLPSVSWLNGGTSSVKRLRSARSAPFTSDRTRQPADTRQRAETWWQNIYSQTPAASGADCIVPLTPFHRSSPRCLTHTLSRRPIDEPEKKPEKKPEVE